MPAKRLLPSDSTLIKWQEEGLTHQDIVDRIRERDGIVVGRSTVAVAFSRMGMTNRIRYEDWLPWHIKSIHNDLRRRPLPRSISPEPQRVSALPPPPEPRTPSTAPPPPTIYR